MATSGKTSNSASASNAVLDAAQSPATSGNAVAADLDVQNRAETLTSFESARVGTSNTHDLTVDQKIQSIASCLNYSIYEANVYWQRNAIYLTINSIMAGVLAALIKNVPDFIIFSFGIFGLYFNWHWRHVNRYSKFLAERWREDARALAESSTEISAYMRALLRNPRIAKPKGILPSKVMNQLSGSFRIVWSLVAGYGLYLITPELGELINDAYDFIAQWLTRSES